jgi:hypothetical protein
VHALIGSYYDLFGWGGRGFFPNTAALVAPPGLVYRSRPQVRLSVLLRFPLVDFELALAAVEPPAGDVNGAEAQAGIRLTFNGWRGASAQLGGPPEAAPLQIGISRLARTYWVNRPTAISEAAIETKAGGLALAFFVPIFPARGSNLAHCASLTLELTGGSGIADMYPYLTGGSFLPVFPNPMSSLPPPVYVATFPQGTVTFDANGNVHTIDWASLALGLQYHLPFARGRRAWVSALYTRMVSDNLLELTPPSGRPGVFTRSSYYDISAFVAATRSLQIAASHQVTWQTFGDGTEASNRREQIALSYFF